jgi:hypothetical protein
MPSRRLLGVLAGAPGRTMPRDWSAAWEKVQAEGRCRAASGECSGQVDPHHIVPRGEGLGDVLDAASNIVPLCRLHHELYHGGDLDLLPYLTHDEQAYAVFLVGYVKAGQHMSGRRDELRALAMQAVGFLGDVENVGATDCARLADRLERAAR